MIVYAEPVGYAWKSLEGGQCEFGVKIDLTVKTAAGETVAEKENFGTLVLKSRAKKPRVSYSPGRKFKRRPSRQLPSGFPAS